MSSKKNVRRVAELSSISPASPAVRGSIRAAIARAMESLEGRCMLAANQTWVNDDWTLVLDSDGDGVASFQDIVGSSDAGAPAFTLAYGVQAFGNVADVTETPQYTTIASALANTNAGPTTSLTLVAGDYVENVTIAKQLQFRGPNAGVNPNTGTRVAEATLRPASNGSTIVNVTASNVSITGVTLDGNNAALTSFTVLNGVDVDAANGVANSATVSGLTVQNNRILNLTGNGVFINTNGGDQSGNNVVANNLIDNLPSSVTRGRGVLLAGNTYAAIDNNVISRVWAGVQTNNSYLANPGTVAPSISGNTIGFSTRGIFHNLQYGSASDFAIANNTLVADGTNAASGGLRILSIQGSVGATVSNNNVSNAGTGVQVWNSGATTPITVSGGTLSGNAVGFAATNNDVEFLAGGAVNATLSGTIITGSTNAGVVIDGTNVNTTTPNPVSLNLTGVNISGGPTGLRLTGANARAAGNDLNNLVLAGQTGNYIELLNGASDNLTLDATGVKFDLTTGAARLLAANFDLEDKIVHALDNASVGLVRVKGAELFVTPLSGSIQRGIDAATAGDTLHVEAGTYVENLSINKALTLVGPNAGVNPNTGTRAAEAIVRPVTQGVDPFNVGTLAAPVGRVITVTANDVSFRGFTVDGDNVALTDGSLVNGTDVDAAIGISGPSATSGLLLEHNVVRNVTGAGVDFGSNEDTGVGADNAIVNNRFDAIGNQEFGQGQGVVAYNNFYATIDTNVFTATVRIAVQTGNHYLANTGPAATISGNTVDAWRIGIWHNLQYNAASEWAIDDNEVTASAAPAGETVVQGDYTGIFITSLASSVFTQFADNTIDLTALDGESFPVAGVWVWNADNVTISGGSIAGAGPAGFSGGGDIYDGGVYGVRIDNFEGYGEAANIQTDVSLVGLNITGTDVAIDVYDNPAEAGAGVSASLGGLTFTGGTDNDVDVQIGADTAVVLANNLAFAGDVFFVANRSAANYTLTAANGITYDETDNFRIEDLLFHAPDGAASGLIRFNGSNLYVTTPGTGASDESIQRAVDAAATSGDTIHVATGVFTEQVDVDAKNLTIEGQGDATVIRSPAGQLAVTFVAGTGRSYRPVVTVENTSGTIIRNLKVDGASNGNANSGGDAFAGIAFHDASGTIDNVTVVEVRNAPFDGVQNGLGIYARNESAAAPHTVTVTGSRVSGYQKNGITIDGPGQTGILTGNTVTGAGPTGVIAQNGIQVSRGAAATITGNTVNGNFYTGNPANGASAGILLVSEGNASVSNNTVGGNNVGIYASQTGAAVIDISGNTFNATASRNQEDLDVYDTNATIGANNTFGGSDLFVGNYTANDYDLTGYTAANFDGLNPATLADAFRIEDKIYHQLDDATSGLVRVVAGQLYVTAPGTGLYDETIQNAVIAASTGDTVNVEAGTFDVSTTVNLDKAITLLGAQRGVGGTDSSRGTGETILVGSSNQSIGAFGLTTTDPVVIDGFTLVGSKVFAGQPQNSDLSVRNNVFTLQAMAGGQQTNMIFAFPTLLSFTDNAFTTTGSNPTNSAVIQIAGNYTGSGAGSAVEFRGNSFAGIAGPDGQSTLQINLADVQGIVDDNTFTGVDIGILIANSAGNLTVSDNKFSDITRGATGIAGGSFGAGIALYNPTYTGPINITGNTFEDSDTGIRTSTDGSGTFTLSDAVLAISGNTFTGNLYDLVDKFSGTITPAGDNVFDGVTLGSATTAELFAIADKVVDRVDVSGYGFIDLKPGNVYLTANSFFAPGGTTAPSLQRAVDAADANETVFVTAGSFGAATFNKTLTLSGIQAGVDARTRTGSESVVGAINFNGASGVTVDGFTVRDGTTGISFVGGGGNTIVNNIITNNGRGIDFTNAGAATTIARNAISNNNLGGASDSGLGVYGFGVVNNTTIELNTFSGHKNGFGSSAGINFLTNASTGLIIQDNVATNEETFVALGNTTNAVIRRNSVTGNAATAGSAIFLHGGNAGLTVAENEVRGHTTGLNVNTTYAGPNSGLVVRNNFFENNSNRGINFAVNSLTGLAPSAYENFIGGNANAGINNDSGVAVNATGNYWGTPAGPDIASNVSVGLKGDKITGTDAALVAYAPFLTDGTDASAAIGFQPNALDATPPAAPDAPDLVAASDSGASATDDVTNDATPTFTGTAEANSVVRLFAGATLLGTAQADGNGNWTITSSPLADGNYAVSATATDAAGNVSSESGLLSVQVDATDPTASFAATPASPSVEGTTVTVDGTVADNLSGVASIAYTVTGPAGTVTNGTTEDFSFLPTDEGTYTISYTVTDLAGNVTTVTDSNYVVTNAAPIATLSGPTSGNEGASLTFTGAATDAGVNDVLTYTYTVTKDGNLYPVTNNSGVNQTSFTFTPDDNATYVVTLTVTDGDGGIDVESLTVAVANVAPTATITGAPASSPEGTTINLASTVTDPGADGATYAWTVTKNGNTYASGTASTFSFTPDDNGTYVVSLTVTDDDGATGTDAQTINVTNGAPTLSNVSVTNTQENGTVTLTGNYADEGSADTQTISIDWGDGSAAQTVAVSGGAFSVTHQYLDDDADDQYTVSVTLADDDAGTAATSVVSTVTNVAPVATITGAPTSSPEGTTISLGSTVTDVGTLDTQTYSWLVTKNGSPYDSGTASTFSFTPDDNGTYVVTLNVTDDDGGQSIVTTSIDVTNVAPANVNVIAPATGSEGTPITVTATTATDAGSADVLTYTYAVTKNGSPYAVTNNNGVNQTSFTFTPDDNATYVVTLTVTDDDNGSTTAVSGNIVVANIAPTVTSFVVPTTGDEGSPITSTATASDPAGSNDTLTFTWTVTKNGNPYSSGTGASYTFTPDDDGTYVVSLGVTDEDGGTSATSTETVAVGDVAPRVLIESLTPSINENGTAVFSFRLVDPGAGDLAATQLVTIDWGDGSTPDSVSAAQLATLQAGGSITLSHVYTDDATAGTSADSYTVRVSAFQTDESGLNTLNYNNLAAASGSASPVVVVNNVAPTSTGFVTPTNPVPAGSSVSVNFLGASDASPRDRNVEGLRYTYFVDYDNDNVIDANELIRDGNGTLIGGDGTYGGSITASGLVIPGTYFGTANASGYVVRGRVLDNDLGVASRSLTIVVTPVSFRVVTLTPNASGFTVAFNGTVDRTAINLYAGANASAPASDVVVTGPSGVVRGSLVFNAATNGFDFVSTGGILAPGTYTVSLASNADAFKDTNGALLDGDADGNAGGNYASSFNLAAPGGPVLSLPDFARGTGQAIDVDPAVAASDLPVTVNTATPISSINFKILFDTTLFSVPASGGVTLGSGVPSGWTVSYSIIGNALTVSLTKAGPAADIQPGLRELVKINASVVNDAANYGKAQVLSFSDIVVNGSASITATGDRAVHKGVFLADADFDGTITSGDASLMQAIVLGYATGFSQIPLIDPAIVADSSGNGLVDSQDATNAALTDVGLRPAAIPAFTPVAVPAGVGADPAYGIPLGLAANAGSTVIVPVNITDDARGIQSGKITLSYDTSKLNLTNAGVSVGTLTNGWTVVANVDDVAGTAIISFFNGLALGGSSPLTGSLLELAFGVEANAAAGVSPIAIAAPTNTAASPTVLRDGNSGLLTTNAASGSIVIDVPPTVSSVAFDYAGTGQSIVIGFNEDVGASVVAGDFELLNTTTGTTVQLVVSSVSADGKTVTLTFADTGGVTGSILQNGDYRIRVRAGQVQDAAGNAITSNSDSTFYFFNADFNHDRVVGFDDLLQLAQTYGQASGATFAGGDANYDGRVDFDDLLLLAQRYTGGSPALFSSTSIRPATATAIGSAFKTAPVAAAPRKQPAKASRQAVG